jgi:uncharacterized protein (TIGR00369 family)
VVIPKFFCVESPFVQHCSIEAMERLADGVRARVVLRPELTNSWGGAHGGLIATLLDASMTVAARYAIDPEGAQSVATLDLFTSFVAQAKSRLDCEAGVAHRRGSMIYMEAVARNEHGEIVAMAKGTFQALSGARR